MDSDQRRKRMKVAYKSYGKKHFFSLRSSTVYLSFFVFLLFVSSDRSFIPAGSFRPVLKVPTLPLFPSRLIRDPVDTTGPLPVIEGRVLFPDHLMLILTSRVHPSESLVCVYYGVMNSSDSSSSRGELGVGARGVVVRQAISVDDYQEGKSIVRCQLPPPHYSAAAGLRRAGEAVEGGGGLRSNRSEGEGEVPSWEGLVYEAMLDRNTAVVFVKGLNLRPHRASDPRHYRCHFGLSRFGRDEAGYVFTTKAITAAQEVIRCLLPRSIKNNPDKAQGIRVTISRVVAGELGGKQLMPSVAKMYSAKSYPPSGRKKYGLCACTMLWNQASFMREWITYHSWLGVDRWFIYDNNSDDELQEVIDELNLEDYNISRHVWPWIKAQEAGFSHCALRARRDCEWLGFFDVDEFFYFPQRRGKALPGQNSLRELVAKYTDSPTYAEIRTICHSYGPSGLTAAPSQGVTVGYTCRLQAPERHKSIVRPDLLDITLLNVVHHFRLQDGYRYLNVPESTALVNHYKYQVWDTFKAKFFRRVSTYVTNWQEDQNQGSKDRAPGLGTAAIEPQDWRLRFCEVWDTGLRDFVLANFADPATGGFPWERSLLQHI